MSPKTKRVAKSKKVPATAAGQALGYSLQYTRLTAMLLEAEEGSSCSLEVLDDIAEQTSTGRTKLGQSKSALTDNPVADRAISLWKTLFNWVKLANEGHIIPTNTVFEIYVSRPVDGELIRTFHDSQSDSEAKIAIQKACETLWGKAPAFPKRNLLPAGLRRYVNTVLQADERILIPMVVNLRLTCGSGSPQADIESLIRRDPVSDRRVNDIADKLCGWVKREVDKQLEKDLPAVLSRDDFHREYVAYVRRVDRDIILTGLAGKPSEAEKLERLPDLFVRQLELIDLTFDEKLEAISDFLRSAYDRTMWSKAGDVHEDSFSELDENLGRAWRNLKMVVETDAGSRSEVQCGKILYANCMSHMARVQGMETPTYFIPGCFHRLADDLTVGWHSAYRERLRQDSRNPS